MDIAGFHAAAGAQCAAGALESLERLLGEHWGRAMWIGACDRAGIAPGGTHSPEELRRVARELMEVPGPAGVVGRTLSGQIALYEDLRRSAPRTAR